MHVLGRVCLLWRGEALLLAAVQSVSLNPYIPAHFHRSGVQILTRQTKSLRLNPSVWLPDIHSSFIIHHRQDKKCPSFRAVGTFAEAILRMDVLMRNDNASVLLKLTTADLAVRASFAGESASLPHIIFLMARKEP